MHGALVAESWEGRPLAIVGTGPSLKGFDFKTLQTTGCKVLAVNNAIYDLPFADAVFSLDTMWINGNRAMLDSLVCAGHTKVFLSYLLGRVPHIEGAIHLEYRVTMHGLSDDPGAIECGYTSGYGALNLGYLKLASPIVLFGFDFDGGHYCEDRYKGSRQHDNWRKWGAHFATAVDQLRRNATTVLNASPHSHLTAFPRVSLEAGLEALRP